MTAYKTREATVKQRPKNPTISHNFSHEKTGVFTSKTPVFGGDKRDRTADLLNAFQALSQLSYTPIGLKALENLDSQDI